jgi:hypothetical protein
MVYRREAGNIAAGGVPTPLSGRNLAQRRPELPSISKHRSYDTNRQLTRKLGGNSLSYFLDRNGRGA